MFIPFLCATAQAKSPGLCLSPACFAPHATCGVFQLTLQLVLQLGNALNAGSGHPAAAFHLGSLLRLADTRSVDNKKPAPGTRPREQPSLVAPHSPASPGTSSRPQACPPRFQLPPASHKPSQHWYHVLVDNPAQVLCHVCLSGAETVDNQIVLCGDGHVAAVRDQMA